MSAILSRPQCVNVYQGVWLHMGQLGHTDHCTCFKTRPRDLTGLCIKHTFIARDGPAFQYPRLTGVQPVPECRVQVNTYWPLIGTEFWSGFPGFRREHNLLSEPVYWTYCPTNARLVFWHFREGGYLGVLLRIAWWVGQRDGGHGGGVESSQTYSCCVLLFHFEPLSMGKACEIFIPSHSLWVIFVKIW